MLLANIIIKKLPPFATCVRLVKELKSTSLTPSKIKILSSLNHETDPEGKQIASIRFRNFASLLSVVSLSYAMAFFITILH